MDYANVVGGRKNQKKGGWRDIRGDTFNDADLKKLVTTAISVPAKTLFLWYSAKRSEVFFQAVRDAKWEIAEQIIWVKNALVFGGSDYQWRHEPCIYARRKGSQSYGARSETTVWEVNKTTDAQHPTQKPVELYLKQMVNHTKSGESTYDPFAGSGSVFIAGEKSGRTCYGMELDPKYVDVIIERWQNYTGKKAKKML